MVRTSSPFKRLRPWNKGRKRVPNQELVALRYSKTVQRAVHHPAFSVKKMRGSRPRLVLRRHGDAIAYGEIRKVLIDLFFPHDRGVPHVVKNDEWPHPADVSLFRAAGEVPGADCGADLVEQVGFSLV